MSEQEPTRSPLADVEAMIRILSEEKRTLRPGDDAQICGQLLEAILNSLIAQSAALEAKDATTAGLLEVLKEQTALVDRLLVIVDCMAEDIGCTDDPDKIWPVLGPVNDQAREAITRAKGQS